MPVRSQQRVLEDVAQQFGPRQFAGIEMAPLPEQATRRVVVTTLQCVTDVGEEVAELAKTQRQVEHQHIECERGQQAVMRQRDVQDRYRGSRSQHRDAPHDDGMSLMAGVEIAPGPADP